MTTILALVLDNSQNGIKRENLLNEKCNFDDSTVFLNPNDGSVEYSNNYVSNGTQSLKVNINTNQSVIFNQDTNISSFNAPKTGKYAFQLKIWKSTNDTNLLNLKILASVNNDTDIFVLQKSLTYTSQFNRPLLGQFNRLFQIIDLVEGDNVKFQYELSCSTFPEVAYIDDLKIEFLGNNTTISDYSETPYDNLVWQSNFNQIGVQNIVALTDYKLLITGTNEPLGANNLIINSKLKPLQKGSIFQINYSFEVLVPIGANKIFRVFPKINTVVLGDGYSTFELTESEGSYQKISGSFLTPSNENLHNFGMDLYLNSNLAMTINNVKVTASQIRK
jgi:hypothetical protein